MAFDGFTLKSVVQELKQCLIGGKITKVYQPTSEEIVLGVYSHGLNYALSCNTSFSLYSLHLTTTSKPNPLVAPNFCMVLRKHLVGFKIKSISTTSLERIAIIELEGYNELNDLITLKLIIELMGKHSNIILINQDSTIIDSLKHLNTFAGSYRNILPGTIYQFPEANKLDIINFSEDLKKKDFLNIQDLSTDEILFEFFSEIFDKEKVLSLSSYFVEHFTGTSKALIDYVIATLSITDSFSFENFKKLFIYLQELVKKIELCQVACVPFENDYVLIANNDIPTNTNSQKFEESCNLVVNFFLDDYYSQKEQSEHFTQYRNSMLAFIMKKLKKISKKLDGVNEKIQECSKMEEYQLYGELLTSNLYRIEDKHAKSIVLENYYNQNELITIPLDISLSPADNAKKYFKKYHKLKNTVDIVAVQKIELEKEIDYLESVVYELQVAKSIKDIDFIYQEMEEANLFSRKVPTTKGSKTFSIKNKFVNNKNSKSLNSNMKSSSKSKTQNDFLSYQIEGFTILVGKNNQENDYLSMKIAKENDVWFHVKDMQGSHVILVVKQNEPSQEIINKVASIAAYYSKAKQSSNVPVDYTLAKYVKKPSKAKPGMVIYTNQKTVNVNPQA